MVICRRTEARSTSRVRQLAGTAALAASLVVVQSFPASAQDLPAPAQDVTTQALAAAQSLEPLTPRNVTPGRDSSAFRSAAFATIAGNLFDAVTTVRGLQNGAREVNPLLGQSPARVVVMKSLLVVPQVYAEKKLVDNGHPKAARWLGYAAGGFAAALAVRNIRVGQ